MSKTLQKKFVITAMIAVSVLLLLLLGTINLINIAIVRNEVSQTLSMLSETEGDFGHIPSPPAASPPPDFHVAPKDQRDKFLASNFFVVRFNESGQVIDTDVSRVPSVDKASAEKMALHVWNQHSGTGKTGKYRYQISLSRTGDETVIVFLDTSEEILSYVRVLLLSGGIGVVCWIFTLVMLIFLSKKAIRPIAESFEKQKQFVTNAGHEIKTPLAIILANTEAMELYNGENKWSKNIRQQVVRLNGLMKNLLLLAKMDENAEPAPAEELCVSELLSEHIQAFSESFRLRSITVQAAVPPGIFICINREQLSQLISILLDNALKYADEKGAVAVGLQKSEKHLQLQVKNSCGRLPDTPPDKLFDRFYRGDKARTQKSGGYGIGLSVAQSIVQANHGSISARYEEPDTIVFTVQL